MSVRKLTRGGVVTPPVIEVRDPAGSVTIEAVEGATELSVRVEALDDIAEDLLDRVEIDVSPTRPDEVGSPVRLRVAVPERRLLHTPSFAIRISAPAGAETRVGVASAGVELRGRTGRVVLTSGSGDCSVDTCTELQLRSASGDVRVGPVDSAVTVGTASGDVHLASVGSTVQVRTASGDVRLEAAAGDVSVRTASGDVTVERVTAGRVRLTTVSGDVTVGVEPGLRVWLDLTSVSGRMDSELADDEGTPGGGADLTVAARSVSGDVRVRRAAPVT